jgi:hypothetical protein
VLPANLSNWFSHLQLRLRHNWRKLLIILIVATLAAIIHARSAAILKYLSALWAGDADPVWPHAILLSVGVLAGISSTIGLLLESRKRKDHLWHEVAASIVICGVVIELFCTICLFVIDERISNRQKETIISLEARIIVLESPRTFSPSTEFASVGKQYLAGKEFDLTAENSFEPMTLALAVRKQLLAIGMVERLSNATNHWSPPNGGLPVGEIIRPGIAVRSCDSQTAEPNRPTPARILGALLSDSGLGSKEAPVFVEPAAKDDCAKAPDVLHVEVGEKIVLPWTPPPGTVVVHPKFQLEVAK